MKKKIIYIIISALIAIFMIYNFSFKKSILEIPINVISTVPKNNSVFVNEKSEIILTLNRIITNEEGNNLKVEVHPSAKTQIVYQENKIRISPETEFNLNTKYEIRIKYKENLIYTLNFETNPFTKEQIETEGTKQTEGDLVFNESYVKFLKENPWYKDIPIEKTDYTIVYDFELLKFRVIMNRKIDDETDREKIIRSATSDLLKIGIKSPDTKYTIQEIK